MNRTEEGEVVKKIFVIMLSVFSLLLCSCPENDETVTEELNHGALEDLVFKTGSDGYEVRGTVRLPEAGRVANCILSAIMQCILFQWK